MSLERHYRKIALVRRVLGHAPDMDRSAKTTDHNVLTIGAKGRDAQAAVGWNPERPERMACLDIPDTQQAVSDPTHKKPAIRAKGDSRSGLVGQPCELGEQPARLRIPEP